MKYLFAFLFIAGCSTQSTVIDIQPEFYEYFQRFETAANENHRDIDFGVLTIYFTKDFPSGKLGSCSVTGYRAHVSINKQEWVFLSDSSREQLIFHELGHCLLMRTHRVGVVTDRGESITDSIMYAIALPPRLYERHRAYYIHELFMEGR